jgi:hypothetical protein
VQHSLDVWPGELLAVAAHALVVADHGYHCSIRQLAPVRVRARPPSDTLLRTAAAATTAVHQNDWIVSAHAVNAAGHTVAVNRGTLRSLCRLPEGEFSQNSLQSCAQRLRLHSVLTIQPAHRYWPFQGWETAIFAVLTITLTAFSFWWTRQRIT